MLISNLCHVSHALMPCTKAEIQAECNHRESYAIVLDDHPLIGQGIALYLRSARSDLPVSVTTTWAQAQQWIKASGCPDVLVADISLADRDNLAAFAEWRSQCRGTPWLAICDDAEPAIMQQARNAGAQGLVYKRATQDVFSKAFAAVLAGRQWFEPWTAADQQHPRTRTVAPADLGLTLRQGDVLALVLCGLSNKRIASRLGLTESTVKEHMTGILQKLGVSNRVHAITCLRGRQLTVASRQQHVHHQVP